ncbi:MAG: hypothetical protein AAF721_24710 [Myxococcota bacterium]
MDRVATFVGVLGLAAAAGALMIGELVVLPGLTGPSVLLGPNLATTIAGPIHLRCAEVALVGTIVLALALPHWLSARFATAAALLAIGFAAFNRLVVLPTVYEAWGKVDLVAARPLARLTEAEALAEQATWMSAGLAVCLLTVAGFVAAHRPRKPAARPSPAPEPAAPETAPAAS